MSTSESIVTAKTLPNSHPLNSRITDRSKPFTLANTLSNNHLLEWRTKCVYLLVSLFLQRSAGVGARPFFLFVHLINEVCLLSTSSHIFLLSGTYGVSKPSKHQNKQVFRYIFRRFRCFSFFFPWCAPLSLHFYTCSSTREVHRFRFTPCFRFKHCTNLISCPNVSCYRSVQKKFTKARLN